MSPKLKCLTFMSDGSLKKLINEYIYIHIYSPYTPKAFYGFVVAPDPR